MKYAFSLKIAAVAAVATVLMGLTPSRGLLIYSDVNDGFLEARDNLPPQGAWPTVHGETFGSGRIAAGEWFGPGVATPVLPFQLPNLGAVSDPFLTADLGIQVFLIGDATVTDLDLYGVRVDADPAISPNDWYNGSAIDPSAALIQESFLTPLSDGTGTGVPNNSTDAAGDAALLAFLNASYAGGAGAGNFVFLRLSYGSDTLPNGWDGYQFTAREAGGGAGEYPVINYTAVPEPVSLVLLGLGAVLLRAFRRR